MSDAAKLKAEQTIRLMAIEEVLGAARATKCPTAEVLLINYFDENPEADPKDVVTAYKVFQKSSVVRGACKTIGDMKTFIQQLMDFIQQLTPIIQKLCPQPTGDQVSCGGAIMTLLKQLLCPSVVCCKDKEQKDQQDDKKNDDKFNK